MNEKFWMHECLTVEEQIKAIKKYLSFCKVHYKILAEYMFSKGKLKYGNEHNGKVKFIELLERFIEDWHR